MSLQQTLLLAAAEVEQRSNISGLPSVEANENAVTDGLAIVFGTFAAIAIVVIIVSGINFITAEGNADKLSKAKRGIIYALLGLVIALSAQLIVFYVVGRL